MNHEHIARPSDAAVKSGAAQRFTFELYEYNRNRRQRGVEAARVKVTEDGKEYLLWMSPANIRANLKTHGDSKGLRDALEAYRINAMPPHVATPSSIGQHITDATETPKDPHHAHPS